MINFYDPKRSISKLQMNFQNVVPLYRQKI